MIITFYFYRETLTDKIFIFTENQGVDDSTFQYLGQKDFALVE